MNELVYSLNIIKAQFMKVYINKFLSNFFYIYLFFRFSDSECPFLVYDLNITTLCETSLVKMTEKIRCDNKDIYTRTLFLHDKRIYHYGVTHNVYIKLFNSGDLFKE